MFLSAFTILFIVISFASSHGLEEFGLDECEKSRACWAFPPECDSAENCLGIMRWRFKENRLHVELQAKPIVDANSAQWMAMAFSDDLQMGNDSVMECVYGIGGDGTANAFISYNYFSQNIQLKDASKKMIVDKDFMHNDDKFGCSFTVDYSKYGELTAEEKKLIIKLDGPQWWHVLFAQGPADKKTSLKQFHLLVQKSGQLVHICEDCSDKYVRIEK